MRAFMIVAVAVLLTSSGCFVDTARIKAGDEPTLVDQKRGGTAIYDELVVPVMEKIVEQAQRDAIDKGGKFVVAFIGIENKGAEELGDHEEAIYDWIEEVLVEAGAYEILSMRYIKSAMREAGIRRPDDLFTAGAQDRFNDVLKRQGKIADYFLWGKMTTQTSRHKGLISKSKERRYRFSMEMIDAHAGTVVAKKSAKGTKAYTDW